MIVRRAVAHVNRRLASQVYGRLSFAASMENLEAAFEGIEAFVQQ